MTDTSPVPAESASDGQGRDAPAATLPCDGATGAGGRRRPRWRGRAAPAVAGWSAFYVVTGAFWSMGGAGYPFGRNDRGGPEAGSLLSGVERDPGARAVLLFGLLATLTALAMHRRSGAGRSRTVVIAAGWVIVAVLGGVVMDARSITLLPPLGLVGCVLIPDWPTLNQLIVGLGALGWTAATVEYVGDTPAPTGPAVERRARASARWVIAGRIAVVVAVLCPLPYAVIRWSWALDRPIGAPASFVEMLGRNQPGVAAMEAILASFACVGAVLTAGLAMRWGRTFPTWLPRVGGRPVPVWLPVSLGTSAAVAIFPFGRTAWQPILGLRVAGSQDELQLWGLDLGRPAFWGVGGLGWLFPIWAISLGVALAGYCHGRRLVGPPPVAPPRPRPGRRQALRSLVVGMVAAAAAVAVLPTYGETEGWIVPFSPALPPPTGDHPVGVRDVHLVDPSRLDVLAPGAGHRELRLSVFYPAADRPADSTSLEDLALAPYVSEPVAMRWGGDVSADLGVRRDAVNWQFRLHARIHAPPARGRHPVLIYTPPPHALRSSYTLMAEELASHGYVVVAVDHTHEAPVVEFPGRRIEEATTRAGPAATPLGPLAHRARAEDITFVATHLDQLDDDLRPTVDVTRVGAFGYLPLECEEFRRLSRTSALRAVAVLATPHRCAPDVAGAEASPPVMVMRTGDEPVPAADLGDVTPYPWRAVVTFPAAQPHHFTDAAVYLPQVARHLGRSELRPDPRAGPPDAGALAARSRQYVVAFFDAHLRARDAAVLAPGDRCRAGVCTSVRVGERRRVAGGTSRSAGSWPGPHHHGS